MSLSTLDQWIAGLRTASRGLQGAMPAVVTEIKAAATRALREGGSIDGEKWPLTKDGRVPMTGAASGLRVTAVGTAIVMAIGEPYVYHHFGAGGKPVRRILPEGALPELLGEAIRTGVVEVLPFIEKRKALYKADPKAAKERDAAAYARKHGISPRRAMEAYNDHLRATRRARKRQRASGG